MSSPGAIAFQIGPIVIRWYGILMATAIVVGLWLGYRQAKRDDLPADDIISAGQWAILAGLAGKNLHVDQPGAQHVALAVDDFVTVGRIAPQPTGCGPSFDRPGRDAVIGDHPFALADDIRAREPALVFQGALPQPFVRRRNTTVESCKVVLGGQWNGGRQLGLGAFRPVSYFRHAGARRSSDRNFGPGAGGLSRA